MSLLRNNLLDELNLLVSPIVVGKEWRLFDNGDGEIRLRHLDSKAFSTGVLSLTYGLLGSFPADGDSTKEFREICRCWSRPLQTH